MNRFLCLLIVTLCTFYLNQPNFVYSSSAGSWGNGASKLNLGVWIPPMTLRLPKFNMPKIKISATIKPRKNQPPIKIHLPEMSLNAKALGDDDSYGDGNSYGGSSSGSYGTSDNGYSGANGGNSYSSGDNYSSGPSYSSSGESYSSGGSTYNDYSSNAASGGYNNYRASASNQNNQKHYNYESQPIDEQYQTHQQQPNYINNQKNYNDHSRYQPIQQEHRNAYNVDNQQSTRYHTENLPYSAANNVQSSYSSVRKSPATEYNNRIPSGSIIQPLSNYIKRDKGSSADENGVYEHGVITNYRYAGN